MRIDLSVVRFATILVLTPIVVMPADNVVVAAPTPTVQSQQFKQIEDQFFDLIIKGKFAVSDLEAAVKSVVYNEDFKQSTIKMGGVAAYQANINNSRAAVKKRTIEVKSAQQAIIDFFNSHPDFISTLSPEVREQAQPIVKLNIPAQVRVWEQEQRKLNREWKCNGSTIHPQCL